MHGGQNPITPQSKTTSRPPAPRCMFLTEVTSMGPTAFIALLVWASLSTCHHDQNNVDETKLMTQI